DLPGARDAVEIAGESPNGWRPLVEAIAAHLAVSPDRIATGCGCSGANFLAMAALLDAGDHVLLEGPTYHPLAAAARMLRAPLASSERRFEDGYRLDPDRIGAALGPRTRLVVITNPHNPSGALARPEEMQDLARLAENAGALVLVDEVYRDTVV